MPSPPYLHPFPQDVLREYAQDIPHNFTFPYHYTPHPLCVEAAKMVRSYVEAQHKAAEEAKNGKMFGVLVVDVSESGHAPDLHFLAAYSAQLAGGYDWPWFVPPIFDILAPGSHFVGEERRISLLSQRILALESSPTARQLQHTLDQLCQEGERQLREAREKMAEGKRIRDEIRRNATPEQLEHATPMLIRESQQQKADYKRLQRSLMSMRETPARQLETHRRQLTALRNERQERSIALQRWVFGQYILRNALGHSVALPQLFATLPPSGAGECCAPKLLQCAYRHGWRPICMAEFWMGRSPAEELRTDGHYYPACRNKCRPILGFMLQGLDVEPNPVLDRNREMACQMTIVYSDSDIAVVNKPSGMLSVPGNDEVPCVREEVRRRFPHAKGPMIVHRLDMDTSGLMVVALSIRAYHALQRQFEAHTVRKRYEALVAGEVRGEGDIHLPLAPNPDDRPRQTVNFTCGREALTHYRVAGYPGNGVTHLHLWPKTGRTHQLRVHCAHPDGLDSPIVGDALYGTPSDRLMLHAAELEFLHPGDGHRMHFVVPPPFPTDKA